MVIRFVPGGLAHAFAGAAMMIAVSCSSSSAFMLSSPSLDQPAIAADIQPA
jgi:hypothetical protein